MEIGNTGLMVSDIGFGAWAIGGVQYGSVSRSDAETTIEAYIESGGNFIDTARAYHASEEILGEVLKRLGILDRIIIASKTKALDEAGVRADVEASLRLLQRDHIDLYYLHSPPDDPDDMNRLLDVFEALKQEGKIRFIGASIKGPDVTQDTVDLCRQYIQSGRVNALQIIYSIFRQKNASMFAEAHQAGVGIVARTSLESGFLTGKYRPGQTFSGDDHRKRWSKARLETILGHVADLEAQLVKPPYQTIAQVALRFALDTPGVDTIIPGAKNVNQMQANLSVGELPPLDPAVYQLLVDQYRTPDPIYNTGQ
jgi:aryl-alcohol dehydrogenase-like predicted oxidoreductase